MEFSGKFFCKTFRIFVHSITELIFRELKSPDS